MCQITTKNQKRFFNNFDLKCGTENKQSCKRVKPCLTDKTSKEEQITLIENKKIVPVKRDQVKIFNDHFSNIASSINIQRPQNITLHNDLVLNAIKNLKIFKVYLK